MSNTVTEIANRTARAVRLVTLLDKAAAPGQCSAELLADMGEGAWATLGALDGARPVSDKTRAAVFAILAARIPAGDPFAGMRV